MAKIKIATDSTADIPANLVKELGIEIVPLLIIHGDKEYKDGVDITPEEFYNLLETTDVMPGSSCVPPVVYAELYEKTYNEGYTDLILVSVNSKGSSTYQNTVMMREEFYEDHPEAKDKFNIHLIDSTTYSMAYGWAVVEAARKIKDGGTAQEAIDVINDWLENVRPTFLPLNLKFVKKSGRVSAAAAFVGDALGLKPVILFEDGGTKTIAKLRGEKGAVKGLLDIVEKDYKPGTPYMLVYGNNMEQFEKLKQEATERLGRAPEVVYPVGNIICINTGPDMIAIIYRK